MDKLSNLSTRQKAVIGLSIGVVAFIVFAVFTGW